MTLTYQYYLGAGQASGISVTQSSADDGITLGSLTIDGSGLSGSTHGNNYAGHWLSDGSTTNQWVEYDFGNE